MFFLGCQEFNTKRPYGYTFSKHTPRISRSNTIHPHGIPTSLSSFATVFPQELYPFLQISCGFCGIPTITVAVQISITHKSTTNLEPRLIKDIVAKHDRKQRNCSQLLTGTVDGILLNRVSVTVNTQQQTCVNAQNNQSTHIPR